MILFYIFYGLRKRESIDRRDDSREESMPLLTLQNKEFTIESKFKFTNPYFHCIMKLCKQQKHKKYKSKNGNKFE